MNIVNRLPVELAERVTASSLIGNIAAICAKTVTNSIEAGAEKIEIFVDFDTFEIRVRDDGFGIKEAELHEEVGEFGILSRKGQHRKGGSLASIRTIADLRITSRTAGSLSAYSKIFSDEVCSFEKTSGQIGTTVLVSRIFKNLPVRRESLNRAQEMKRIKDFIRSLSLLHHAVEFSIHDLSIKRTIFKCTAEASVSQRIVSLYSASLLSNLSTYSYAFGSCALNGFMSFPRTRCALKTKEYQTFFVNTTWTGRADVFSTLIDKVFSAVLSDGKRKKGGPRPKHSTNESDAEYNTHPCFVLHLTCPPGIVEIVNESENVCLLCLDQNIFSTCCFGFLETVFQTDAPALVPLFRDTWKRITAANTGRIRNELSAVGSGSEDDGITYVIAESETVPSDDIWDCIFEDSAETTDSPAPQHPMVRDCQRQSQHVEMTHNKTPYQSPTYPSVEIAPARLSLRRNIHGGQMLSCQKKNVISTDKDKISSPSGLATNHQKRRYDFEDIFFVDDLDSLLNGGNGMNTATSGSKKKVGLEVISSPSLTLSSPSVSYAGISRWIAPSIQLSTQVLSPALHSYIPKSCAISRSDLTTVRVIGQADKKFILGLSASGSLVAFDQHAVDERLKLEFFEGSSGCVCRSLCLRCLDRTSPASVYFFQPRLSFSLLRTDQRLFALKQHIDFLKAWGFQVITTVASSEKKRDANYQYYELVSVPIFLGERLTLADFLEFLSELQQGDGLSLNLIKPPALPRILASQACRRAIKFGDVLDREACASLLSQLVHTSLPFICAHGRPSVAPLIDDTLLTSLAHRRSHTHLRVKNMDMLS